MSLSDPTEALPRLAGEAVTLRPTTLADVPALVEIVQAPGVWERWGNVPASEFITDLESDEAHLFTIEIDTGTAGLVQFYEEDDRRYYSASIDIFLAPRFHRRGLGPDAIRTLARYLFEVRGHHRITIDPAADNLNAIAAYRKVGFRPVGIMRRYERIPADEWHDGLLMDLLREELT
ncbi:MAG: GNAT family protein [Candidatus Dormibacteria bacterium]